MDRKIKTNWDSKDKLLNFRLDLSNFRDNNKGFNDTIFFLGFALTHTGLLLKKKVVLSQMESKASRHLVLCLAVGLTSGTIFGQLFGRSYYSQKRSNRMSNMLEQRLQVLK